MSFVIQRVTAAGLSLSHIGGEVLRIGRGTNAELRSDNPAVALEHAVITHDDNSYTITDKGSITGTYVNGRPVESARLSKGDAIDIGDLRIDIESADPAKPLFVRVTASLAAPIAEKRERERAAMPGAGELKTKKIDYADAFRLRRPWLTKLSVVALLLIFTLGIVGEIMKSENQIVFMPGGVSSAHARARDPNGQPIGKNCAACHDPWRGVSDSKCVVCHTNAPHSDVQIAAPSCFDCHVEHRGATKLATITDDRCVACHANLPAHRSRATLPADDDHIASFETHSEFPSRVDRDTLRFNHHLHLQPAGIFNADGKRETLSCPSCHRLVESKGKADPAPVSFNAHCRRCHQLTFDARFPDAEVPHGGDPGLVYGFVLATYAGNRDIAGKSPAEVRRLLTLRPTTGADERAVLNAEQVIKTKCTLCHEIKRGGGHLVATAPVIPTHWLVHAKFSHTQHRNLDCESCHSAARASVATSDVLLPSRSACVVCHGARGAARISSRCVTCHDYHERSKNALMTMAPAFRSNRNVAAAINGGGGARMIEPILLIAIAILMLVIAVPVGIFIYQRLVASAPQVPTVREVQKNAQAPTMKVPAMEAPPPQPPTPSSGVTRIITRDEEASVAAEPQATAMVHWHGMLRCTSGPLEGQTFIIEEAGVYIGRDPKLSQIVINDTRVSKRHVRIVPRGGHVMAIDQDSTNGTFLGKAGGQRITEVELKRGDIIVLADNAATFQYQI